MFSRLSNHFAFFSVFTFFYLGALAADDYYAEPPEDRWGLSPGRAAVVNPATRADGERVISLRGTWDFCPDLTLLGRHRMGKGPDWNEPDWGGTRTIEVPGCWENQGVGVPGPSRTWDPIFDNCVRPMKNTFWGTARYRKIVSIPADWPDAQNGRIWLAVGGVRSEAYLWVNKKRVAHVNNYCGTYKFDISDYVKPGEEAEIVATVRNDSPSRKGQMTSFNKFGGFYRDLEISSTPNRWLDDVWVRGDLDAETAEVHLRVAANDQSEVKEGQKVRVTIESLDGKQLAAEQIALGGEIDERKSVAVPIPDLVPWSPENPRLYVARAELLDADGSPTNAARVRFGIKKFEVRGNRFYLNNRPYFLRGYGDDWVYPVTLVSPADRETHLEHFRVIKEAGFNYVRLHTHCELPEFFEAADEAGIMVQPELPYYHDITTEAFDFDPLHDLQELCVHFRRYVSFAAYSLGNEGHLGSPLDVEIYRWVKANDPDRLIQHQDGGCNITEGERKNADFDTPNGYYGATSILPWPRGTFDYLNAPFVAHEYMNLAAKMDPRSEPLFTGGLPAPRTIADYEAGLAKVGLSRLWGDRALRGIHALQGYYQKLGVESARRDPACDGFSYWTLVDVMVPQAGTYTGQGFLDAFYQPKEGGLTPKQFAEFNAPTVLLADFSENAPILVSGETLQASLTVSHFGTEEISEGKIRWSIRPLDAESNEPLAVGETAHEKFVPGDVNPAGTAEIIIPEVSKPVRAEFCAALPGTGVVNRWPLWLFPQEKNESEQLPPIAASPDILPTVQARYPDAVNFEESKNLPAEALVIIGGNSPLLERAIREERRILFIGSVSGDPNIRLGWWSLGGQLGTGFNASCAAFGDFPLTETLDGVWFRILRQGAWPMSEPFPYGKLAPLAVGETVDSYSLYAGSARIGGAKILATFGLDLLADLPEAKSLLRNFVRYAATSDFAQAE